MAELKQLAVILLLIAALMLARAAEADIYTKDYSEWIEDRKGTGTQFGIRIGRERLSFQGWVDEYPGTLRMSMRYLAAVYVDAIYNWPAWIESNTVDYCSEYYLTLTWCANMSQPSTCSVVLDDALLYEEYPASLYLVPMAGSGVSYYLKKLWLTKDVVLSRFTNLVQETGTGVLGAVNGWVYGMKAQFAVDYAAGYTWMPPPKAQLTVQVYRVDASGRVLGAANGTKVKIGNTIYTADSSGKVTVEVDRGSTVSVQVLDTYYGQKLSVYWRRYTFSKWSDGSTSNPRSFTVSSDTTVTAYVYDERLLLVLYDPHYGSDPWGVKALQLPDRYSSYVGQMLPYNASFWLRPSESFTLQAVEGGAARFLRWDTATECYPRNPYSLDPAITLTMGSYGLALRAVFRLGPSNQTMYLPGEGIPNPVFWPVYQQHAMGGCDGRKGTWLLNVTAVHAAAQTAFNLDNRTWIYALLVNPSSILESAWVPVNGSWKLYIDKDWDAAAHKLDDCSLDNPYADACRYVAYDASSISDFPQVVAGAPSKYRGWRLIALAAWKPLLPNESYSAGAVSAVWSGSATYALYNVTFKHVDSGWVYWQPVAVSALKIESAVARYKLSSYDSQLRRSPIFMWIEAVVDWSFVPPNSTLPSLPPNVTLWMAGFKPHRIGNVGV
ncbi:MAG: hypothetical protein LM576_04000, partial [Thermofilum sp.]|nr:hypothetical protein [Thermofilum sp.]